MNSSRIIQKHYKTYLKENILKSPCSRESKVKLPAGKFLHKANITFCISFKHINIILSGQ